MKSTTESLVQRPSEFHQKLRRAAMRAAGTAAFVVMSLLFYLPGAYYLKYPADFAPDMRDLWHWLQTFLG